MWDIMKDYGLEITKNKELLVDLKKANEKNSTILEEAFQADINYINSFTEEEDLLEEIFYDYLNIKEKKKKLSKSIKYLETFDKRINSLEQKSNLSLKDILNDTKKVMLNILWVENYFLICGVVNNTPMKLLQKMTNIIMITLSTYILNLKYFTSNYYKNKLTNELNHLKIVQELTKLVIESRELELKYLNKELKLEIIKLLELSTDLKNIEIDLTNDNLKEEQINKLIKTKRR